MEAILELPGGLPGHIAAPLEPVPSRVVAAWPEGTFLENLAILPDGDIAVSVLSEARIDRVSQTGARSVMARLPAPPTGLAMLQGALYATVGEPGRGEAALWRFDAATGEGAFFMRLEGVTFANGLTPLRPGTLLVAESWQGRLVRVDLVGRTVDTWFEDERLTRAPGIDLLPGANGTKRYRDAVVVTSNGRALILSVAIGPDGDAGSATVVCEHLRADDIAFDVEGSLYLTTHIGHSLDRLDADGVRVSLGGIEQGLAGSTACAFHPDGGLYVTTTGGIVAPPGGVLQPARLVRLDVGKRGHALEDFA